MEHGSHEQSVLSQLPGSVPCGGAFFALAEANPVYPVPVVYDRKRCEKVIRRIIAEA